MAVHHGVGIDKAEQHRAGRAQQHHADAVARGIEPVRSFPKKGRVPVQAWHQHDLKLRQNDEHGHEPQHAQGHQPERRLADEDLQVVTDGSNFAIAVIRRSMSARVLYP